MAFAQYLPKELIFILLAVAVKVIIAADHHDHSGHDHHNRGHHDHGDHHHHDDDHDGEISIPAALIPTFGTILSIICVCGVVGNVLSSIILRKSDMRISTKYILLGLTFFDTLVLVSYLSTIILYAADPYDGHHSHENVGLGFYYIHTQFIYPISQTAYTGSVYAIILLTIERYIAVCWPLVVNRFLTKQSAIWALVGLFSFSILLNLPRWFDLLTIKETTTIIVNAKRNRTRIVVDKEQLHHNQDYITYYHGVIWTILMYAIPFLILGVLNFLIWKEVREANIARQALSPNRAEISITKMLLTVVGVFLICNAINCILVFTFVVEDGEHHAYIIGSLIAIPLIINSSVNIVIYCVKGKSFRSQFQKIINQICCCRCCTKKAVGKVSRSMTVNTSSSTGATNLEMSSKSSNNNIKSIKTISSSVAEKEKPSPVLIYRLKKQDEGEVPEVLPSIHIESS